MSTVRTVPKDIRPTETSLAERHIELEAAPLAERLQRAEDVISWTDEKLATMAPLVGDLLQTRLNMFMPTDTGFDLLTPVDEQLYHDPSYNDAPIKGGLDHRNKGALGFNEIQNTYNPVTIDTSDVTYAKEALRSATVRAGQKLRFLPQEPGIATDVLNRWLDMQDSEKEPVEGKVDAIIVAGAAGLSNLARLQDAINDIESGAVDTDLIIMATCYRTARDDEKQRIAAAGFTPADNEFEECIAAAEDLLGISFRGTTFGYTDVEYEYGKATSFSRVAQAVIGDKAVRVVVMAADRDPGRPYTAAESRTEPRPDTRETFVAAATLLPEDARKVVVKSHDTWINYQDVVAHDTFSLEYGLDVTTSGPRRADRIFYSRTSDGNIELGAHGDPIVDVNKAEEVIDEIGKVYQDLVKLRVKALSVKDSLLNPRPTWRDLDPQEQRMRSLIRQNQVRHPWIKTPPRFSREIIPQYADEDHPSAAQRSA